MPGFHLQIVTPDGPVFDGNAEALMIRTKEGGYVEILRGHADYFATLEVGQARLVADGKIRTASASGGFISVKDSKVRLVPTTFEFAEEIDVNRAKRAKECAEATLNNASDDRIIKIAKAKLARAINRINVAELK